MKLLKISKKLKFIIKKVGFDVSFPIIVAFVALTAGVLHFINPSNIIKKTEKFYKG